MDYETFGMLVYTVFMVIVFAVVIAFEIVLWTTIWWTFDINFAWGLIWMAVSQVIFGGVVRVGTRK